MVLGKKKELYGLENHFIMKIFKKGALNIRLIRLHKKYFTLQII